MRIDLPLARNEEYISENLRVALVDGLACSEIQVNTFRAPFSLNSFFAHGHMTYRIYITMKFHGDQDIYRVFINLSRDVLPEESATEVFGARYRPDTHHPYVRKSYLLSEEPTSIALYNTVNEMMKVLRQ